MSAQRYLRQMGQLSRVPILKTLRMVSQYLRAHNTFSPFIFNIATMMVTTNTGGTICAERTAFVKAVVRTIMSATPLFGELSDFV
jgi:hypothetical protein